MASLEGLPFTLVLKEKQIGGSVFDFIYPSVCLSITKHVYTAKHFANISRMNSSTNPLMEVLFLPLFYF